jgi:hypothetical protein
VPSTGPGQEEWGVGGLDALVWGCTWNALGDDLQFWGAVGIRWEGCHSAACRGGARFEGWRQAEWAQRSAGEVTLTGRLRGLWCRSGGLLRGKVVVLNAHQVMAGGILGFWAAMDA